MVACIAPNSSEETAPFTGELNRGGVNVVTTTRPHALMLTMLPVFMVPGWVNGGKKDPESGATEEAVRDVLARFDKDWQDYTNEPHYGDPRWKLKLKALLPGRNDGPTSDGRRRSVRIHQPPEPGCWTISQPLALALVAGGCVMKLPRLRLSLAILTGMDFALAWPCVALYQPETGAQPGSKTREPPPPPREVA